MSETGQDKAKFFNLHLKQQNIRCIERHLEITYTPSCGKGYFMEKNKGELMNSIVKEQTQEQNSYEECLKLWSEYQDYKNLIDTIINYLECLKITKQTSTTFVDKLSKQFPQLKPSPLDEEDSNLINELEMLQDTFAAIFSESTESNLHDLWSDLEMAHKDYNLATKNFKILLEILDFESHELYRLKKQYDDVLVDVEHAKINVGNELPHLISNCSKVLSGGLSVWASLQNSFTNESSEFAVLVSDLKNALSISDDE